MFNRLPLILVLFVPIAASPWLPCFATSFEDLQEIREANALPDSSATIKHLDNYLLTHPKSARVFGFRAEVNNVLAKSNETIRDANRYFELNKERELPVIYKVRAHAYIKLAEYRKALHDLDAAKKLDAKDGDTVFMRALALEHLGRFDEALLEYSQAIDLKCDRAFLNKGSLEFRLKQPEAGSKDYVSYIQATKSVIDQENLARVVFNGNNDLNSIAFCDALIRAKVAKQFVYIKRANLLCKVGRFDEALRDCDYCEAVLKENVDELRHNIHICQGHFAKSLLEVERKIAKAPKDLRLYLLRARCHMFMQNYELALADFDRAEVLLKKNSSALLMRAECYFQLGKYTKAETEFASLNKAYATDRSLKFEGLTLKNLKKYREASECFTRALKKRDDAPELLTSRADCYFRLHEYGRSDSDYSRAIALNPKETTFYYGRGMCREAAGNLEAAVNDFTVALAGSNFRSVVYAARARAYAKLGKKDLAAKDLLAAGKVNRALEGELFKSK